MHSEGSTCHGSDSPQQKSEGGVASLEAIHARPHNNCDEGDEDGADLVLRDDKLDGAVMDEGSDFNYPLRYGRVHVVELILDAEVAADGDALELLEVVVGPGESQGHGDHDDGYQ